MNILKRLNRTEKSVICAFLAALMILSVSDFTAFAQQCSDIRQKVFRLHILANSDSTADQALKLKVRDEILSVSGTLFAETGDKQQAEETVKTNLDKIRTIAQQEVYDEGYSYKVGVEIVNMFFTTRTYSDVTLPAGNYDALRITIGAAKGHNWWCVLFPPLCLQSAESTEKLTDVLGDNETGIVTNSGQNYVIKFKTLEIIEDAKNWFAKTFSGSKTQKKT
jgi:stage II sporulation protein R